MTDKLRDPNGDPEVQGLTSRLRARFPVKGARDAMRNFEAGVGPINGTRPFTLSRSRQQQTEEHRTNHQPPPRESKGRGRSLPWCTVRPCQGKRSSETPQKRDSGSRGRTREGGTQFKGAGDGEVPSLRPTTRPPRDPDVSWSTRGSGKIRRVRVRRAIVVNGVTRDEKAGFFQNRSKVISIIRSRMDDVTTEVVTGDPISAAPTG